MIEIIMGTIILILVADRIITQRHYDKLIDKFSEKLLVRDYSDYQLGQAIKKDERQEEASMSHTDEAEAKIEEERNRGLLKHVKEIDRTMEGMIIGS